MSLFQCEKCGCVENTALSNQGFSFVRLWDWTGLEEWKGKKLCSACGPAKFRDGTIPKRHPGGKWHDQFKRRFLPLGMFETGPGGGLIHKENGDTDYRKYECNES